MQEITWQIQYMREKLIGAAFANLLPILGGLLWHPYLFILLPLTAVFFLMCFYEIYASKCKVTFGKKTILIQRPFHKDVEYPLAEVTWSARPRWDFKSAAVFIHRGQKKVMRITEIWENFDYLMTFPHLHPNRQTELELIKKRNERLKWEKKLIQIKK
ncbi:MAG: hypothetical protein J6D19_09425 [Clostridia bacterium]|nr:hypothetical protein [Clostridia bacterium]